MASTHFTVQRASEIAVDFDAALDTAFATPVVILRDGFEGVLLSFAEYESLLAGQPQATTTTTTASAPETILPALDNKAAGDRYQSSQPATVTVSWDGRGDAVLDYTRAGESAKTTLRMGRIDTVVAMGRFAAVSKIGDHAVWIDNGEDVAPLHSLVISDFTDEATRVRLFGSALAFEAEQITRSGDIAVRYPDISGNLAVAALRVSEVV